MRLRRAAKRHQAGVDPSFHWEFLPGDRVLTAEGLIGRVVDIEDGPFGGDEQYLVELEGSLGGGEYTSSELTRAASETLASREAMFEGWEEFDLSSISDAELDERIAYFTEQYGVYHAWDLKEALIVHSEERRRRMSIAASRDPEDPNAGVEQLFDVVEQSDFTHAGLVIKALDTGRVLLTQRTPYHDDPEGVYGRWEFPGGSIGDDEDPVEGAIREFQEETGLTLPEGFHTEGAYQSGTYLAIVISVAGESWTSDATLLMHETEGIGWFEIDEIENSDLTRDEMDSADWDMIREAIKKTADDVAQNLPSHTYRVTFPDGSVYETTTTRHYEFAVAAKKDEEWGIWSMNGRRDLADTQLWKARDAWGEAQVIPVDNPRPDSHYENSDVGGSNRCPASGMSVYKMVDTFGDPNESYRGIGSQFNFECLACGAYVAQTRKGEVAVHNLGPKLASRIANQFTLENYDGDQTYDFFETRSEGETGKEEFEELGYDNLVVRESDLHFASEDYPELSEILVERPPLKAVGAKEAGFWDRALEPLADYMIENQPEDTRYDAETGRMADYPWCRFLRDRRCHYPRFLNEEATEQAGYAVWIPEDRGFCPHSDNWDAQRSCPAPSEPGPNADSPRNLTDATIPWEQGGQRYDAYGSPVPVNIYTSKQKMEMEAAWVDVSEKAKRIKDAGGVQIVSATPAYLLGTVQSETGNTYHNQIMYESDTSRRISRWTCSCDWGKYAWARSAPWAHLEGRKCAHVTALYWEAQSRGMFGQEVQSDSGLDAWAFKHARYVQPFEVDYHGLQYRVMDLEGGIATLDSGEQVPAGELENPLYDPIRGLASLGDDVPDASLEGDTSGDDVDLDWLRPEGELKDEPEAALPETTGEDLESEDALDHEDIVKREGAATGREWIMQGSPKGQSNEDIAMAAQAFLKKTSVKDFTPAEQAELIGEGEGVMARNLGDLQIEGTHYEALEEALQEEEESYWGV